MKARIVVDPRYKGPTLAELEPVISDIEGEILIPWGNTKVEIVALERFKATDLEFVLHVKGPDVGLKTAVSLGLVPEVSEDDIKQVKENLTRSSATGWRNVVDDMGPSKTLVVMSHVAGAAIRNGKRPLGVVSLISQCLYDGVHPSDVDALVRLQKLRKDT